MGDRLDSPEGINCTFRRSPIDHNVYLVFEDGSDAKVVSDNTPLHPASYSFGQYENAVLFDDPDEIIDPNW